MQRLRGGAAGHSGRKLEKGTDREGEGGTLSGAAVVNRKVDSGRNGFKVKGKTVNLQGEGGGGGVGWGERERAAKVLACMRISTTNRRKALEGEGMKASARG